MHSSRPVFSETSSPCVRIVGEAILVTPTEWKDAGRLLEITGFYLMGFKYVTRLFIGD